MRWNKVVYSEGGICYEGGRIGLFNSWFHR